jgi:outer membrane protein assembly factor BamB
MNDRSRDNSIRLFHCCIILLLIIIGLIPSVAATNTMFRANHEHTGVYDYGGIVPTNIELWRFTVENFRGGVISSPAVANGIVFVGSEDNNLYAIDAVTGKEKWRFEAGTDVLSSPAVSNGIVYVGSNDNNLYAIDALMGKEKWRFKTGDSVMSSPTVADDVVYVGSNDNNLYAIDALMGKEKWRFTTEDWVTSSPAVANGIVFFVGRNSVGSEDNNLYAIDAVSGKEKWQFKMRMGAYSSPAVANGVVYIGSNDNNLYAIDALTGKEGWRFATGGSVTSSPAIYKDVIYIGSLDSNVYAIDSVMGTEKWRFLTGNPIHSSPAVSDGVVYIGSYDTNLYAIDAMTGREKWRFTTGDYIWSSPSVSGGIVYTVSGDNNLYAVGRVSSSSVTTPTVVSTMRTQSTSHPLSNSPSHSTLPPTSFDMTFIFGLILLICIGVGGYYVLHSRKPTEDFLMNEPEPALGISMPGKSPIQKSNPETKSQNNRDLIFISSKSEDFEYAQQLYAFLKDRGYNVFFSQQTLPDRGSSDYRKEIDRALDVSKHMIVVTSKKEYVEASWVEAEWGLFINEKRSGRKLGNIITLIIGAMRIEDLPGSLRYYEVMPFDPKTFEKILKYLK